MAKMMPSGGKVYGIEHINQLVKFAENNIRKHDARLLEVIVIIEGDGRKGLKQYAPYDVIHVGAAVEAIPQELLDQLASGGIMVL